MKVVKEPTDWRRYQNTFSLEVWNGLGIVRDVVASTCIVMDVKKNDVGTCLIMFHDMDERAKRLALDYEDKRNGLKVCIWQPMTLMRLVSCGFVM